LGFANKTLVFVIIYFEENFLNSIKKNNAAPIEIKASAKLKSKK
jgi:hypothetical protein